MSKPLKTISHKNSKYVKEPPKLSLPPNTTAEEDVVTAGQRKINLVWELTQAFIAVSITWAIIYMRVNGIESDGTLTNAFFLIVSMYFIRTNHSLIGGTGAKHGTR